MSTTVHTQTHQTTNELNPASSGYSTPRPRRNRHKPKAVANDPPPLTDAAPSTPTERGRGRGAGRGRGRSRGRGRPHGDHPGGQPSESAAESDVASSIGAPSSSSRGGRSRRGKFSSHLTDSAGPPQTLGSASRAERAPYTHPALVAGDLTSTLIDSLRTPPYPDCPICFNSIHPAQPSWSCSPSTLIMQVEGEDVGAGSESVRCCWTTFHLKCIRAWAGKSVKDVADAWRARGEDRLGDWRCPGCQAKRLSVPSGYWCFCGLVVDPKPPRLATPHSCANPCSRSRVCNHQCPLPCHPGPCPPCAVTTSVPCYCGKDVRSFRCSNLAPMRNQARPEMSCGQKCGKMLGCGNHACERTCHPGECGPCTVMVPSKCWCGKEERELNCGEGDAQSCLIMSPSGDSDEWVGMFACTRTCERFFECGIHQCFKPCHVPPTFPAPCPQSPSILTHCPCGKHEISPTSTDFFDSRDKIPRTACTDPIPTCTSTCMKPLNGCSHVCSSPCHEGPCSPCSIQIVRPCRCGSITRTVKCYQFRAEEGVMCDRPCPALRACGRHRCNRLCCPLAALAAPTGKKKGRKPGALIPVADTDDETALHACDLVCGKTLSCGNHTCEERDHRGTCPPCLRSSFDEMVCHCGRTVLMPPIPCGTRLRCVHPCTRPPPACGHSRMPHACHDDTTPCPPCPFLTSKPCACRKKSVGNVRCSQEKVSCGTPCGKLLACGFHKCNRLCHGDACGTCTNTCGKPRKHCFPDLHPCTQPCHAPSSCPELEPCMATVTLTCSCGRIKQASACGRSATNPLGRAGAAAGSIKCSNECAMAKRNARLAEALGIAPDRREEKNIVYAEDLMVFARANQKFCLLVEKTFSDFVTSDKKTQVLPHMPPDRRKFVSDLASVYRMDVQMVDQEPQRSVQLIRRIDTRVPAPLLSTTCGAPLPNPALGKLATNLRSSAALKTAPITAAGPNNTGRGWTSVINRAPAPALTAPQLNDLAAPQPTSSRWSQSMLASAARPTLALKPASSVPALTTPVAAAESGDVPDNWEDDL